jgi:DHA2 family multidrug resistance protein
MTRVLGGAVGTAILSTAITMREHLHSEHLVEAVSLFSSATRERIAAITTMHMNNNGDIALATQQTMATLNGVVQREAFVMAYSDSFFLLGSMLLASVVLVWLADRIVAPGHKGKGQ